MAVVSVVAGALLLLLLVHDVFATVFVPRGRPGPLTRRVYAGFWGLWRRMGDRLTGSRGVLAGTPDGVRAERSRLLVDRPPAQHPHGRRKYCHGECAARQPQYQQPVGEQQE